jgi:hypothetical protein
MRTDNDPPFPSDAIEVRRFKAIQGLSDAAFDSLRSELDVWTFGSREFVSEAEGLRAIGRRAVLRRAPADARAPT